LVSILCKSNKIFYNIFMAVSKKNENQTVASNGFKLRYCFYIVGALLILMALFSHSPNDYAVIQGGTDSVIENWIGSVGAHFSCFLLYLFGIAAYPIVVILVICALRPLLPFPASRRGYSGALVAVIIGLTLLFAISPHSFSESTKALGIGHAQAPQSALSGGVIGQVLAAPGNDELQAGYLRRFIGAKGTITVALVFLMAGLVFIWLADWQVVFRAIMDNLGKPSADRNSGRVKPVKTPEPVDEPEMPEKKDMLGSARDALLELRSKKFDEPEEVEEPVHLQEADEPELPMPQVEKKSGLNSADPEVKATVKGVAAAPPRRNDEFTLPLITMLSKGDEACGESAASIEHSKQILQQTLESFNVDGQVSGTVSGPRVTRYEISLAPGVKVEKVSNISNNIAMELEAQSIRILAPIPGKNAVGVEAPNSKAEAVFLRSVMESTQWNKSGIEIPIVLGKDVSGKSVILDLAKAPHLLIAGATGSGKSVCMNTLIMSLLFRFKPEELRMIMVDPKVVEMEMYSSLPHLITPVVNDPQKVPIALRWAVNEMEKRYRVLAKARVKNLKGFNTRPIPQQPVLDDDGTPIPDKMPILVIIVDELADVMMTDAKADVETSIARIAQKGRAAGIHIVIATQRPSTNIITGVIKANLPTRIAFRVGSIVDSRVILDQKGAETLLGRGDMLFIPPGSANLERIQGAMVEDADIEKVVDFVSGQAEQQFDNKVVSDSGEDDDDGIPDASIDDVADIAPIVKKYMEPGDSELICKALEIILMERKASTSYLQRRLKIGYNRAAELIDIFEERGLIGPPPPGGSKRDILVFDEIENG
jgi:S-DNA-T family DNA segregation ATPase FtsK/SpoIIIE